MPKMLLDDLLAATRAQIAAALRRAAGLRAAPPWPLALDATAGNGNDTEFLARHVSPDGLVLAFDVQNEALERTRARLVGQNLLGRARLIRDSHANAASYIPPGAALAAVMFNLGFLPGGEPGFTTLPESTLAALNALSPLLTPGGLLTAHCYTGQDNGPDEAAAVEAWMRSLPWQSWRVCRMEFCNKTKNAEILYLAEKIAEPSGR